MRDCVTVWQAGMGKVFGARGRDGGLMSAALQSLMVGTPDRVDRPSLLGELLGFVVIGVCGALAFVAISSATIMLQTGFADWIVNTGCYAVLILPVYLLHRKFSFQSNVSHWRALPRYMAVQSMALVLAALFSYVVHGMLMLPTVAASMLVIALTSGINFVVLRSWAFARQRFGPSIIV